jgi:hypothetical protein
MTRSRSAQQRKVQKAKPGKMGSPSMGGGWATLPPPIKSATIKLLDPGLIGGFASVARRAGLQFRESRSIAPRLRGGETFPPFFRLVSLQAPNGDLVPDAQRRINDGGSPLGFAQAIAAHAKGQQIHATPWGEFQLKILQSPDTVSVLGELQGSAESPLRFFRLRSTDALLAGMFLWRLITEVAQGVPPAAAVRTGRNRDDRFVGGLVQVAPASFVCYPLLGRNQPLAAVFTTEHGTQVIVLPSRNAFVRPIEFVTWPVGTGRIHFGGPGQGVYATSVRAFPEGHAEALLRLLVRRADAAFHHLTAPERWTTSVGVLDADAFWLSWSSILLGMDAVTSLGAEWNQPEAIWTAFRALSILQGIWQGDRRSAPHLSYLLDPRILRQHAISSFPQGPQRDWASGVIDNYEGDVKARFPATTMDDSLKEIAEIRNLLHGVQATGDRIRRLKVLYRISEHSPNLQLINEVAAFWWMAALLDTSHILRPGIAPWEVV